MPEELCGARNEYKMSALPLCSIEAQEMFLMMDNAFIKAAKLKW